MTGSVLALLAMFCQQLAASNLSTWRAVLKPGPASLDEALAAICGSLALALTLWLLSAVLLSLIAALASGSSALGAALSNAARLLAPTMIRNAVAALLGVTIAASPAVADATTGLAATGSSSARVQHSQASIIDDGLSPAWVPSNHATALQPSDPKSDLLPGWVLDRPPEPAGSHSEPAPPTTRASAPSGPRPSGPRTSEPRLSGSRPAGPRTAGADSSELSPAGPETRHSRPSPTAVGSSPGEPATPTSASRGRRVDQDDEIVVRRGDTLWNLAGRHLGPGATNGEIAHEWPHWFTANRAVIGGDPDLLVPGERLRPPGPGTRADDEPGSRAGAEVGAGAEAHSRGTR